MSESINRSFSKETKMPEHLGFVQLFDRNILVIGTEHGRVDEPFPGRQQTEEEIAKAFGGTISGLAVDGLYAHTDIQPSKHGSRNDLLKDTQVDKLPMDLWARRKAMEKHIPLIAIDPAFVSNLLMLKNYSENFAWTFPKEGVIEPYQTLEYKQMPAQLTKLQETQRLLKQLGDSGAAVLATGTFILKGLESKKKISRRGLFKGLLGLGGAATLGGLPAGIAKSNLDRQVTDLEQRKKQLAGELNALARSDQENIAKFFSLGKQPGESDYNQPYMQRFAEAEAKISLTLILRNAIAAEVLTLPLSEIMPDFDVGKDEKPNIAAVWGWGHITLPEKFRIPFLLQNEEERRILIETLLQSLFQGAQDAGMPKDRIEDEKEQLKNFGNTFAIDQKEGIIAHPFRIPALETIIDNIIL